MLNFLFSPAVAQGASGAIVVMCSMLIGRQAAFGMGAAQWGWSAVVMVASIALAVLVWSPSVGQAGQVRTKDDDAYY